MRRETAPRRAAVRKWNRHFLSLFRNPKWPTRRYRKGIYRMNAEIV